MIVRVMKENHLLNGYLYFLIEGLGTVRAFWEEANNGFRVNIFNS